jgi:hypothetical protein
MLVRVLATATAIAHSRVDGDERSQMEERGRYQEEMIVIVVP